MEEKLNQIYQILTHRKIKRAQPKNSTQIKKIIKISLKHNKPLIFTIEWFGVKTKNKGMADNVDKATIIFLTKNIIEKILKIGIKKIFLKILFADINASYINGYSKEKIDLYWRTLKKIIKNINKNFKIIKVSNLFLKKFQLNGKENIDFREIAKQMKVLDIFKKADKKTNKICKSSQFKIFQSLSKKHSLLFKKRKIPLDEIARRYIFLRIFTSMLYEKIYPNEIFLSFSYPQNNNLLISQPILYIFSFYKGFSDCPWFTSENNKKFKKIIKMGKIKI